MTPLAFELMRDLTTPGAFHSTAPRSMFWPAVQEATFFEATAVEPMTVEVRSKMLGV
jgi:hypothetical protein